MVEVGVPYNPDLPGVPNHQIGVGADGDAALAGREAEQASGIAGRDGDEFLEADATYGMQTGPFCGSASAILVMRPSLDSVKIFRSIGSSLAAVNIIHIS
nr:hypothetical protein [Mesorhizobium delmotii]